VVDSADATPTTQAGAVYLELEGSLEKLLAEWKKMRDELPTLNTSLKKAHVEGLDVSRSSLATPPGEPDQDAP
jgi:hypothetical protein